MMSKKRETARKPAPFWIVVSSVVLTSAWGMRSETLRAWDSLPDHISGLEGHMETAIALSNVFVGIALVLVGIFLQAPPPKGIEGRWALPPVPVVAGVGVVVVTGLLVLGWPKPAALGAFAMSLLVVGFVTGPEQGPKT
ncbi:MAG: hypothetical protein RBU21_18050 [FCB group bacterium]|jgi:hypothetical protein|nr:hypothetical protein [FCB group bacterium]